MNPYDYPVVFFGGMTYVLERTKVDNGSFFGGGYEKEISGLSYGPRNLHHIFTLNGNCCAPIRKTRILDGIPLLYGLCFSGCRIAYRFDLSGVDILDMAPRESSVSWPYEDYPDELPFFYLQFKESFKSADDEWSVFMQHSFNFYDESRMYVVVNSGEAIGVPIWSRSGHRGDVQICFEIELEEKRVLGYNISS